jgi:fructose-bisphosphate aldolase, class II
MLLDPLQSRALFTHALEQGYALLAVNADSPAAVADCLEAARRCDAPVIVEASLWQLTGRSFGMGDSRVGLTQYLAHLAVLGASARYQRVPILFHTDHIRGPETIPLLSSAISGLTLRAGPAELRLSPSTVSLDSSQLTEDQNIAAIAALSRHARECGRPVTLEMEAGVDDGVTPLEVAERLLGGVEAEHPGTVWLWAPGVGTRHGHAVGGYPEFSIAAIEAHRRLAGRITGRPVGIALHGSSGLPEEALRAAVQAGVVKVNWSSESLSIRATAAREYYRRYGDCLEPGHPEFKSRAMDPGLQEHLSDAYVPRVMERIQLLGGAGRATAYTTGD